MLCQKKKTKYVQFVRKKKQSMCSPVEAQGNEKALVNASPNAGHLDLEISRCNVVSGKTEKVCAV